MEYEAAIKKYFCENTWNMRITGKEMQLLG